MITVHEPERTTRGGITRVAARVDIPGIAGQTIWFEAEGEAAAFLTTRADAFAAALLPVACALSQPLEVRGAVSPRLAWGMRELLRLHRVWWPRSTGAVEFVFPRLEAPREERRAVGCSFSGGVDSLFSAFRHLPRNEAIPACRITHLVVVNGFDHDLHLHDRSWSATMRAIYGPLAEQEGVQFVEISTNLAGLMSIGIPLDWYPWLGTLLAIPGLALGDGLARFYIGATEGYANAAPCGSSPLSDPWFSTESLHIVHDGPEATRTEKLETIAEWPATFDRLRVCRNEDWRNLDVVARRIENCASCDKCVRTMITLRLLGKLDRFTTFRRPLTLRAIAAAPLSVTSTFYVRGNVRLALRTRRYDLVAAMLARLALSSCRNLAARIARRTRRIGAFLTKTGPVPSSRNRTAD